MPLAPEAESLKQGEPGPVKRLPPARTKGAGILALVWRWLVLTAAVGAAVALLVVAFTPALFVGLVLLLVALTPVLLVALAILATEDALKARTDRDAPKPGEPSRDISARAA